MIPYGKQFIDSEDIQAVVAALQSDWLTQGPKVKEFENALAAYCGAKYAVAVSNGTAALHLSYLAAGFKPGDEVITSPNTFVATTNMLKVLGAKPVFCDIRLDTYNIDEEQIESLITEKTRAIVPVHFAGQPANMARIHEIAKRHHLLVIADGAHALGSQYAEGKDAQGSRIKVGSCVHADMTTFSFHPVKPITTGEGGAIVTNSEDFYKKMMLLRSHGIYKDAAGKNVMIELGYNYRITDIQTALGASQMKKLDGFIAKRREVVEWYREELQGVNQIIMPAEAEGNYSGWHIYIVRVQNSPAGTNPAVAGKSPETVRDELMEFLKQQGIGVNFHYPAVYSHPYYQENGYAGTTLPNEDLYHQTALTLPLHQQLTRQEVTFICDQIKTFFNIALV